MESSPLRGHDDMMDRSSHDPVTTRSGVPRRKPVATAQAYEMLPPTQDDVDEVPSHPVRNPNDDGTAPRSRFFTGFILFGDVLLTLVPVLFIALASAALALDNKVVPATTNGNRSQVVIEAEKLGPSIFPIVFAAVVGRLVKTYALWRAERGVNIGLLEQLLGSTNLVGTLQRALLLSRFGFISVCIVALWCISPLGGQSSLRVLGTKSIGVQGNQTISYYDTNNTDGTMFIGDTKGERTTVVAIYQAVLLAPATYRQTMDLWGNVKIPIRENLLADGLTEDNEGFVAVDYEQDTAFSSLTGLMVAGLSGNHTTAFSVESTYLGVQCSNPTVIPAGNNSAYFPWLDSVGFPSTTQGLADSLQQGLLGTGYWINTTYMLLSNDTTEQPDLLYIMSNDTQSTAYNCSVSTSRVESLVTCTGQACQVDSMRQSIVDTRPNSTLGIRPAIYLGLLNFLQSETGQNCDDCKLPTAFFVGGSASPYSTFSTLNIDVTAQQASDRLTALVNTVWQTSISRDGLLNNAISDPALYRVTGDNFATRTSAAVTSTSVTVYAANHTWCGCTIAISVILLVCGVLGMAFKYMAQVPDVLGYVSTMTVDNPYFPGATGSGLLDGVERAKLLYGVDVKLMDVQPQEKQGHIALKRVEDGDVGAATKIIKGRVYL